MKIFLAVLVLVSISLGFFSQLDYKLAFLDEESDSQSQHTSYTASKEADHSSISHDQQSSYEAESLSDINQDQSEFIPNPSTVASLREARINGDSRAPKLTKHHEREEPTEEELEDHDQYVEYERRQQKRVYRAYVEASKIKTKQIRDMIELGKSEGISDEEIAFAEEKIRGIEEMAAQLQQDYPDIMEDSYQPPSDWLIENLGKESDSSENEALTP